MGIWLQGVAVEGKGAAMRIHIDFFGQTDLKKQYQMLLGELEAYRDHSIKLVLNGKQSTPDEIAKACMVAETGCYMREYVGNDQGIVTELWFQKILGNQ
jgi:hypothetical protein